MMPGTDPVDGDDPRDRGVVDEQLRQDHRHELGMLWRGLVAAMCVVAVRWLRQRYFL